MPIIIYLVSWVILVFIILFFLLKLDKKRTIIIIKVISLFLIIQKTIEHLYHWNQGVFTKIPVDFSAIAYFLFPVAFLFSIKLLKPFVVYIAFLSGVIFLAALPFKGLWYLESWGAPLALLSFLNHSLLFIASIIVMKYYHFTNKTFKNIAGFTFIAVLFAVAMKNLLDLGNSGYFIYQVLDGRILDNIYHNVVFTWYTHLIYLAIVIFVYIGMIFVFYKLNSIVYKKYCKI